VIKEFAKRLTSRHVQRLFCIFTNV
jgi:hypothetical protein